MNAKLTAADKTAIRNGVRDILTRRENGRKNFEAFLVESAGITAAEATKVLNLFLKERIAKFDGVGQVNVKHGAFLDVEVIRRAAAL